MAIRPQRFGFIIAWLWCADAYGLSTTTEIGHITESTATLLYGTDEATTAARDEITYACPAEYPWWHSCQFGGCSEPQWLRKFCHCDELCEEYSDCCPDYKEACVDRDQVTVPNGGEEGESSGNETARFSADLSPFSSNISDGTIPDVKSTAGAKSSVRGWLKSNVTKCVQTAEFDPDGHEPRKGYWLVAVCPMDWSGDPGIRELCQDTAGIDGFDAIPVEGTDGRHYRNVYCAMCHGLPRGNITFWSVSYTSGLVADVNTSQAVQIARGQSLHPGFWKTLQPPGKENQQRSSDSSLRTCVIVDRSPCLISHSQTNSLCRQHFAPIAANGTTFRNLACSRCDGSQGHPAQAEWCPSTMAVLSRWKSSMISLLIFSDRVEVSSSYGKEFMGTVSCTPYQIYDPFLDVCRYLTCPDGFVLTAGGLGCARIYETEGNANDQTSKIEVALTVKGSFDGRVLTSDGIWDAIVHQTAKNYQSNISACRVAEEVTDIIQVKQNGEFCRNASIVRVCAMDAAILDSSDLCLTGSTFTCKVNVSFESGATSVDQFIAGNEIISGQCLSSNLGNVTIQLDYFVISTFCESLSNQTRDKTESNNGSTATSKVAYILDNHSGSFTILQNDSCKEVDVECPLLTFSKDDYVITGALKDSIKLKPYNQMLRSGEFNMKANGEVEVCNFFQGVAPSVAPPMQMSNSAHFILTVVGSSLSLVGVVVTIATYVAFPTLRRNAAGRSLMSLVVALFLAQLTMLIGLDRTDVRTLCAMFAIGSHYFWLAAFFWMNTLAIDIYRTFGIGTKIYDPNVRRFGVYALYAWGAPTLIVVTVAVLSFCGCVEADVTYGSEHVCWVGNGMANLLSFGLPVITILCSNAVLFSLTVAGVRRTRTISKRMNITQGQSGSTAKRSSSDLVLYLKLTAIMGFTWIFGFVASFSGVEFFWYPFIGLNSTQGVLVCLAFVCNRRVLGMWRAWGKLRCGRYLPDASDTSGTIHGTRPYHVSVTDQSHAESATKITDF